MGSIINNAPPPPSTAIFPRSDVRPHLTSTKPPCLSNEGVSSGGFLRMHNRQRRMHSFPARVGSSDALFLAATTAPKSADISLLLPTSAVMLFVYWIANFVLPDLILKDIQAGQTNEDGGENSPVSPDDQASSGQVKKGFGGTKRL